MPFVKKISQQRRRDDANTESQKQWTGDLPDSPLLPPFACMSRDRERKGEKRTTGNRSAGTRGCASGRATLPHAQVQQSTGCTVTVLLHLSPSGRSGSDQEEEKKKEKEERLEQDDGRDDGGILCGMSP